MESIFKIMKKLSGEHILQLLDADQVEAQQKAKVEKKKKAKAAKERAAKEKAASKEASKEPKDKKPDENNNATTEAQPEEEDEEEEDFEFGLVGNGIACIDYMSREIITRAAHLKTKESKKAVKKLALADLIKTLPTYGLSYFQKYRFTHKYQQQLLEENQKMEDSTMTEQQKETFLLFLQRAGPFVPQAAVQQDPPETNTSKTSKKKKELPSNMGHSRVYQSLAFKNLCEKIKKYYYKCISRLVRMRQLTRQFSKDLSKREVERCAGYSEHLFTLIMQQRIFMPQLEASMNRVQSLKHFISTLPSQNPEIDFVPPQSLLKKWTQTQRSLLDSILNRVSEVELLHQTFEETPGKAQIAPLLYIIRTEVIAFKNKLPEEVVGHEESTIVGLDIWNLMQSFFNALSVHVAESLKTLQNHIPPQFHHLVEPLRQEIASSQEQFHAEIEKNKTANSEKDASILAQEYTQLVQGTMTQMQLSIQNLKDLCQAHIKKEPENEEEQEDKGLGISEGHLVELGEFFKKFWELCSTDSLSSKLSQLINLLDDTTKSQGISHVTIALLHNLLPLLDQFGLLLEKLAVDQLLYHKSLCKLEYVLLNVFNDLFEHGFCIADEEDKGQEGEVQENVSGVGLGEGEGSKDISDQIKDEEELTELTKEEEKEAPKDKEKMPNNPDEGFEMENDFEGEIEDLDKNEEDENEEEEKDEKEPEKEMGNIDSEDENIIDERLWEDEDEDNQDNEQEEKTEKNAPIENGLEEAEIVANTDVKDEEKEKKEEKKGREKEQKDKKEEKEGQENEETGEDDQKPDDEQNINEDEEEKYEDNSHVKPREDEEFKDDEEGKDQEEPKEEQEEEPKDMDLDNMNLDKNEEEEKEESTEQMKEDEEQPQDTMDVDQMEEEKEEEQPLVSQEEEEDVPDETGETEHNDPSKPEDQPSEENFNEQDDKNIRDNQPYGVKDNLGTASNADVEEEEQTDQQQTITNDQQGNTSQMPQAENEWRQQFMVESYLNSNNAPQPKQKPLDPNPYRSLGDAMKEWKRRLNVVEENKIEENPTQQHKNKGPEKEQENQLYEFMQHNDDRPEDNQTLGATDNPTEIPVPEKEEEDGENIPVDNMEEEEEDAMDTDEKENPQKSIMNQDFTHPKPIKPTLLPKHDNDELKENKAEKQSQYDQAAIEKGEGRESYSSQMNEVANATIQAQSLDLEALLKIREQLEEQMMQWKQSKDLTDSQGIDLYHKYELLTSDLAQELCEQLRLILEPTLATKLKGDYKTGKRINMKKVIPYIASDFKKDKIWLRRTQPSKRQYQVMLAIDDSQSMLSNHAGQLACEALTLIAKALSQLEVGELSVVRFGETLDLLHPFGQNFSPEAGAGILSQLTFNQTTTKMVDLMTNVVKILQLAKTNAATDNKQLVLIISDGRFGEKEGLKQLIRDAQANNTMLVFIILDNPVEKDSILQLQSITYPKGQVKVTRYIDMFPFPYYIVLQNIQHLPEVLGGTLRQWFELLKQD